MHINEQHPLFDRHTTDSMREFIGRVYSIDAPITVWNYSEDDSFMYAEMDIYDHILFSSEPFCYSLDEEWDMHVNGVKSCLHAAESQYEFQAALTTPIGILNRLIIQGLRLWRERTKEGIIIPARSELQYIAEEYVLDALADYVLLTAGADSLTPEDAVFAISKAQAPEIQRNAPVDIPYILDCLIDVDEVYAARHFSPREIFTNAMNYEAPDSVQEFTNV